MSLRKAKQIDIKTRIKICGYLRKQEYNLSISIPVMIQYVVMVYYWINEKFAKHGDNITLRSNGKIARCSYPWIIKYNTVYGNNVIDIQDRSIVSYKWTFKLNLISAVPPAICIGLDSTDKNANTDFARGHSSFYSVGTNGCLYNDDIDPLQICKHMEQGDYLKMYLRIDNDVGALSFQVNDGLDVVIGTDIWLRDYNYNMAISIPLRSMYQEIELVEFEIVHK